MEWIKEYRDCPVCDSAEHRVIGTRGGASHRDGIGEETSVVRCAGCSSLYARPTMIPVGNPYDSEEDYFEHHDLEGQTLRSANLLRKAEAWGVKGRVLELGCGQGEGLRAARELGWEAIGVEMTEHFVKDAVAQGLNVELATIEDCKALENRYSVVLMSAILEHLYRPVDVLKRIGSALEPGGLLFVDIPNEASLLFKVGNLYARPWSINLSPTFPPYHVVGFSPTSIRKALGFAGLSVKELKMVRYDNFLPQGSLKRRIESLGLSMVQSIGHRLGQGDGMMVWAQKSATKSRR